MIVSIQRQLHWETCRSVLSGWGSYRISFWSGFPFFFFFLPLGHNPPPLNIVYVTCPALEDIFHLQPCKDLFHFNVLWLSRDKHLPDSRPSVAFVISADSPWRKPALLALETQGCLQGWGSHFQPRLVFHVPSPTITRSPLLIGFPRKHGSLFWSLELL